VHGRENDFRVSTNGKINIDQLDDDDMTMAFIYWGRLALAMA